MFNKVTCNKCKKKVNVKYTFCPYCGNRLSFNKKRQYKNDYGLLGKNDFNQDRSFISKDIILPKNIDKILNSLLKNFNLEINGEINQDTNYNSKEIINKSKNGVFPPKDIQGFSITLSDVDENPRISITPLGKVRIKGGELEKVKKESGNVFSNEQIKKFSNLKKEEPKTEIRRFSDSLVYEFLVPEVKSLKDISLLRLENSIELKAIGTYVGYTKVIPVNMPIKRYYLSEGKLSLEFILK